MIVEYCDQLPSNILRKLCDMLDKHHVWEELGERMKYSQQKIYEMDQSAKAKGHSPSKALLDDWARYHHYTVELNKLLFDMEHAPAMECMKPCVDSRFSVLLDDLLARVRSPGYEVKYNDDGSLTIKPPNDHDAVINGSTIPSINYTELTEATGGWSERNKLGAGGFGAVYKANWKNSLVAVKRLYATDRAKLIKELIREIGLDKYRHDNIIPLYGYSIEDRGSHVCLVQQLMTGGSLDKRIHNPKHDPDFVALTWPQRHQIALGVARGLQYLHDMHQYISLIHTDIKPANILLDEYLKPKIADFGLCKEGFFSDKSQLYMSKIQGTWQYLPVEYLYEHKLTRGLDTYSFGVTVLEMVTGRPSAKCIVKDGEKLGLRLTKEINDITKDPSFDKASLEDIAMKDTPQSNPALFLLMLSIGQQCTSEMRKNRPSMNDVYNRLNDIPKHVIYKQY